MHNLLGKQGIVQSTFGGLIAMSDPQGVPVGGSPRTYDTDFEVSSVSSRSGTMPIFTPPNSNKFSYVKTFETRQGIVRTLALDNQGNLFVENPAGLGTLATLRSGIAPNTYGKSVTLDDREYICFSDLSSGIDLPLQYTGDWIDKITQGGPGAPPVFTAISSGSDSFPIATINQPAAKSYGSSYFLQSTGPGSNSPGNVVTVYYADSTTATADADLVAAFNSGNPVYIYTSFTGAAAVQGPYVVQVTSVSEGPPPSQPRPFFYFTYNVPSSAYTFYAGSGNPGYTANYQRSLATLTTSTPVPDLVVSSKITVTGTSAAGYNSSWTIAQNVDSGSMTISQSSLTSGTATYSYSVANGAAPTAGQLVTITNTLNGDGSLNGVNLTIASSTGGATGTFTVSGFSAVTDYASQPEQGNAVTAGEMFTFDPGIVDVGTSVNPIIGSSTGGSLIFIGATVQLIGQGVRQGVEFYITRNGAFTFPSPPVTFTTPANTTKIVVSQASIGPPEILMRGYAITEAGQNGTPGGNFFTIPEDSSYIVNGVHYPVTALIIPDNTSTTASFTFTDQVLLNATAIDIQGNDQFNQIEIGNPAWVVPYASRMFYGLTQSKVQNFINLSFDGGIRAGTNTPLGWMQLPLGASFSQVRNCSLGGYSYYSINSTGTLQTVYARLTQTAYLDVYDQPILRANTLYSARITARSPSGVCGALNVQISAYGELIGSFVVPSLTTTFQTYTGTLVTTKLPTVPTSASLAMFVSNMPVNGDVEIARLEIFPTQQPTLSTQVLASYINKFEQVDQDSGNLDTATENQQPCNGGVVMNDILYLLKDSSLFYTQDSPGEEPDQWPIHSVSATCGACGPLAFDSPEDPNSGQQWITTACRNGLYVFTGGEPGRIMLEIRFVWDAINWNAGRSIWVKQDIARQRIYVGVPLPTPNFWLPNAPANANPTSPNVIFMCNYQGIDTGEELKSGSSVIKAAFAGNLEVPDLRRKWSIWQIPSLNAALIKRGNSLDALFAICNGAGTGKIYQAGGIADDGAAINAVYTTSAFTDTGTVNMGNHRKNFGYFQGLLTNTGNVTMKLLRNQLEVLDDVRTFGPNDGTEDVESDIDTIGQRVFLEFSSDDPATEWSLSNVIMEGRKAPWSPLRGV